MCGKVRARASTRNGKTRWWAKDNALRKVFGSFANPDNCLYVDVILSLTAIQEDMTMKTTARIQARGFVEALLKYEIILTAQTFLRIFEQTSQVSKYLPTQGMDILSGYGNTQKPEICDLGK